MCPGVEALVLYGLGFHCGNGVESGVEFCSRRIQCQIPLLSAIRRDRVVLVFVKNFLRFV